MLLHIFPLRVERQDLLEDQRDGMAVKIGVDSIHIVDQYLKNGTLPSQVFENGWKVANFFGIPPPSPFLCTQNSSNRAEVCASRDDGPIACEIDNVFHTKSILWDKDRGSEKTSPVTFVTSTHPVGLSVK
ncbi:hypothetical protein TNCV_351961 [Trichonephila clavipes]|nr:hypothetical protein TNCV_351961 [Trichonephila clavipes]